MKVDAFGKWEIVLPPNQAGGAAIPHDSKVKIHFRFSDGTTGDRVPAWACVLPLSTLLGGSRWEPAG